MKQDLPFYKTLNELFSGLTHLANEREIGKKVGLKRIQLSKEQRKIIYEKTSGKCHVCGCELTNGFEADHIKNHTSGGSDEVDNFLPTCRTCNNYRRHYSPEELQWILKLGVWAKSQIIKKSKIGLELGEKFVEYEINREKRRSRPRE